MHTKPWWNVSFVLVVKVHTTLNLNIRTMGAFNWKSQVEWHHRNSLEYFSLHRLGHNFYTLYKNNSWKTIFNKSSSVDYMLSLKYVAAELRNRVELLQVIRNHGNRQTPPLLAKYKSLWSHVPAFIADWWWTHSLSFWFEHDTVFQK